MEIQESSFEDGNLLLHYWFNDHEIVSHGQVYLT